MPRSKTRLLLGLIFSRRRQVPEKEQQLASALLFGLIDRDRSAVNDAIDAGALADAWGPYISALCRVVTDNALRQLSTHQGRPAAIEQLVEQAELRSSMLAPTPSRALVHGWAREIGRVAPRSEWVWNSELRPDRSAFRNAQLVLASAALGSLGKDGDLRASELARLNNASRMLYRMKDGVSVPHF